MEAGNVCSPCSELIEENSREWEDGDEIPLSQL